MISAVNTIYFFLKIWATFLLNLILCSLLMLDKYFPHYFFHFIYASFNRLFLTTSALLYMMRYTDGKMPHFMMNIFRMIYFSLGARLMNVAFRAI